MENNMTETKGTSASFGAKEGAILLPGALAAGAGAYLNGVLELGRTLGGFGREVAAEAGFERSREPASAAYPASQPFMASNGPIVDLDQSGWLDKWISIWPPGGKGVGICTMQSEAPECCAAGPLSGLCKCCGCSPA
jgi:hypothetical protein